MRANKTAKTNRVAHSAKLWLKEINFAKKNPLSHRKKRKEKQAFVS